MATVINSSPATFTTVSFGPTRCGFAIPAGQWTSAQWSSAGTWSGGGSLIVNTVVGTASGVTLGTHGGTGTYSDSVAATAAQLADINAVAGSTLHAEHNTSGFTDTVTTFTLTLTGSGGVVVISGNAAQMTTYFDALSTLFAGQFATIGLGGATESGTLAALAQYARKKVLGDGSVAFPGLGNAAWQAAVRPYFDALVSTLRYDALFAAKCRAMVTTLDGLILNNLPAGWKFIAPGGLTHALDANLTRINGSYNAPATPTAAGTLTAINSAAGALPLTTAGSAPRVAHTLVGAYDYSESLPSPEATQVAIAAPSNAYSYQIAGSVPAGVKKVRLYRGAFAGASGGPYFWDQDVAVTAGSAYPALLVQQADAQLRLDWNPPAWLSALMTPEAALIIALAYATASVQPGAMGSPLQLQANGMLAPTNVALSPSNAFLGLGNPAQSGQFGARTLGSAYTPYGFQTANNAAANVQGFAGGVGLQARVTTLLNGTLTVTPTYTYYDAAHGWGSPQTDVATGVGFGATAAGSLAVFSIPAGRIVQSVTGDSTSGTATSGAYLYEAPYVRTY
jgi:hypothetical protein